MVQRYILQCHVFLKTRAPGDLSVPGELTELSDSEHQEGLVW